MNVIKSLKTAKTRLLHITGIAENSWQPPTSCIKAEKRTGCQNGPSAWTKLWMLQKWSMGKTGNLSKLENKAVVSKTTKPLLRYCTATIHCQCQQVRIVLKYFHGHLKLSKMNKTADLMMQLINTFVNKPRCSALNKYNEWKSRKIEFWLPRRVKHKVDNSNTEF